MDAIVHAEVVQEVMFVLVRRGRLRDGLRLARDVLALFPGLFLVTRQDMLRACGLLERYPRLPVRDAIHVATMLNNGLQTVVSVDADFDQVVEIRRVAPGSA
jgi:predicted nucleic acid-binding protein